MIGAIRQWMFRPEARITLVATRIIVGCAALWILLSRPDLPSLVRWPREFWSPLNRALLWRFGSFVLNAPLEWALYIALLACLAAVIAGIRPGITALVAGVLLYHFGPLDEIFVYADLSGLNGLAVPVLALFILSAAEWTRTEESSPEYRWPVVLIQLLFALSVLIAGITKLMYSGPSWYTPSAMRSFAAASWAFAQRSLALRIATGTVLPLAIVIGSVLLDFSFMLMVFLPAARWFVIPLALTGLYVRSAAFGFHWLSAPLLLLFVNWPLVFRAAFRRNGNP